MSTRPSRISIEWRVLHEFWSGAAGRSKFVREEPAPSRIRSSKRGRSAANVISTGIPIWRRTTRGDAGRCGLGNGGASMSDSLTTRPAAARSAAKQRQPKSEPSSTSDLLRPTARIDQFLLMHSARLDNWREITGLAEKWQAGAAQRADLDAAVAAMEAVEGYHAYPGPKLFALLRERIAANDAGGAARLARRISNGLMTRAYRERPSEW